MPHSLASKIQRLLTTDFLPGANTYVYWLKEPVGWFCTALLSSVLVGAFLSPIGWSVAGGLAAIILLGLGFPWIATRSLRCALNCDREALHEGDETHIVLSIRNPLPIPVMGLVIKGYFAPTATEQQPSERPECGLARVPAFSKAEYRLPIKPEYRGRYPVRTPDIACSFPFGIYTARSPIAQVRPVVVRPLILPIAADFEWSGDSIAETGFGMRASDHGEFLGVREFRRGDSLRSIHWTQSARQDEIIVCERGGPQKSPVAVRVSTARCIGTNSDARENLAWRIRIAASLIDFFVARHIPFELFIDDRKAMLKPGGSAKASAWDALSIVPLEPWTDAKSGVLTHGDVDTPSGLQGITIGVDHREDPADPGRHIVIMSQLQPASQRQGVAEYPARIDLEHPIDVQLAKLLQEVSLDSAAI